jgi:large subunit ribosomal protein L9
MRRGLKKEIIDMGTKMKVLLVQDVDKLGSTGEVKEVSGGYGRNYLIPKGLAVMATRGQVRQAEERLAANRKRAEAARKDAEALASRISGQTLRFIAKVGELDRLYGSITSADIAEKIQSQTGVEVDRRKIDLDEPIKRIGIYPVKIRLMAGLEPLVNVVVEGEEGAIQLPPDPDAAE